MENSEDDTEHRVFQLTPKPRQFLPNVRAISFRELLLAMQEPKDLLIKRRLALTLACSVLQFHESAFLGSQWSEDHIYFFHTDNQAVNYRQPYINSPFGQVGPLTEQANPGVFHPNIGILKLGILLIEVHIWMSIEKFRVDSDKKDGALTANADFTAALRLLDFSLTDCFANYKSAIRACLDVDWVPAGSRVSLEDATTRDGLYRKVIVPIREEIEFGEKMAKKHGSLLTSR